MRIGFRVSVLKMSPKTDPHCPTDLAAHQLSLNNLR